MFLPLVLTSDFPQHNSFVASVNNISFAFPRFPLLNNLGRINESMFCSADHYMSKEKCIVEANKTICRCVHRLKVQLNSSVELRLYNINDAISHPIHLHGLKFHVLEMMKFNGTLIEDAGKFKKFRSSKVRAKNPPFKDTVTLPFPGAVRLRFRANNPGFWLMHCHYDWHMPIGMALIVQVGEIEQMKKTPNGFPTCDDYLPTDF